MKVDKVLDAKGLLCPMPVIKARKAIKEIALGQVLEVQATDKGAMKDFEAWSRQTGNELLDSSEAGGVYTFHIRKAKE
ncbi:MAG: sulfurtransferase TusA family protein [Deltaproteobacteria bacterium]|nr:sulfurtransferase TusA family protein [Deltaproteobacteria bacterium]